MQLELFPKEEHIADLENISEYLRIKTLETIKFANTWHLWTCMSSLELLTTLYFWWILKFNVNNPKDSGRDYVLWRWHRWPLRYNIFAMLWRLKDEEMCEYRKYGSRLPGHEDMDITPWVDITPSGSLWMLLSYAVWARYEMWKNDMNNTIFCFLWDGEEQEGNVSEAARSASALDIKNLIVVIDQNTKQLSTNTSHVDGKSDIKKIREGYGWEVIETDGHDVEKILAAYSKAKDLSKEKLVCIIAKTKKWNTIPGAEKHITGYHVYHETSDDNEQWRRGAPIDIALEKAQEKIWVINIQELLKNRLKKTLSEHQEIKKEENSFEEILHFSKEGGDSYSYLEEYFSELNKQKNNNIRVLTADYPPRWFTKDGKWIFDKISYDNVGIREQHLFAMVHGISSVNKDAKVIILCGEPFLYRSADQINVLNQSSDNIIIYAVQVWLSWAQNWSTHQSSAQAGFISDLHNINFYEPASKEDRFSCMNESMKSRGLCYIRTHKGETDFSYNPNSIHDFNYKISFWENSSINLVASGMTCPEVVKAAEVLLEKGINTDVIIINNHNSYSDIISQIQENPTLIFYNGNPSFVANAFWSEALKQKKNLKISSFWFNIGTTWKIPNLLKHFWLDSNSIIIKVEEELDSN